MVTKGIWILIVLLYYVPTIQSQKIVKIEPPNWWVGMKEQNLQLMVYGDNISDRIASIKYEGIILKGTQKSESPNYLFLNVFVESTCKPGLAQIILKSVEGVDTAYFSINAREEGSASRTGFSTSDVIYLITPDRFSNGDTLNDTAEGMVDMSNRNEVFGRHGGDIEGVRQHLDYISDLGITSLWLNPVLENDMSRHSYHGYAITDFYNVDPRFGSNSSYKNLCQEASERGLSVIMDMVVNHCGLNHPWVKAPPFKDWINYQDKPYVQTNHRKTTPSDPYAAREDIERMTQGWFVATMPDLNTNNPYLGTYLIQNAIWWIEYSGIRGIRMDTYLYPDEVYMSEWSRRIMEEYPDFNIAGEVWYDNPAIVSYWQKNKVNANGYVSWLPSLFDFPVQSALIKSLTAAPSWEDNWVYLYEMVAQDFQYPDPQNLVVFADNHDMSRIFTQVNEDYLKYKSALTYILTTRGIPQLFYGTEILMSNKGTDNHGIIRSDFPGGWKGDKVNAFTNTGLSTQQAESQLFIKKLLNWRKKTDVIHKGKTIHFVPQEGVYVYFRYDDNKTVMVILNNNEKPVTLRLERFKSLLSASQKGFDVLEEKQIKLGGELYLPKAGPTIIEITK